MIFSRAEDAMNAERVKPLVRAAASIASCKAASNEVTGGDTAKDA
jgi:hypothetical protein